MAKLTAYLNIFEQKLDKLRKDIKKAEEEKKPNLEQLRKEAKSLEKTVHEMQEHDMVQVTCPHCEKKFQIEAGKVKMKTS